MNNRFEARTRQNRTIALMLTFLFHLALFGGLYYYNVNKTTKTPVETVQKGEEETVAKPVANTKRVSHKP